MQNVTDLIGIDKVWVYARRHDTFYLTNKFLSVFVAAGMAVYTQSLKITLRDYDADESITTNTDTLQGYNIAFWTLFIYYAFHAVDELIELYAVYFKREKGGLGLLLELNNFLGLVLIGYMTYFYYQPESVISHEKYHKVESWLKFQVIFFYCCAGLSALLGLTMFLMQRNFEVRKNASQVKTAKVH